jgi:biotin carboxyl carrier protein
MKLKITVHGVAYEVDVEILDAEEGFAESAPLPPVGRTAPTHRKGATAGSPGSIPSAAMKASSPTAGTSSLLSPIAGTVLELECKVGDQVTEGQPLVLIEAMKMKTAVPAPGEGRIGAIQVAVGDTVREGQVLVEFE